MTGRGLTVLAVSLGALYAGMSLGGRMYYLAAVCGMLSLAFALISVIGCKLSLRARFSLSEDKVSRGETAQLLLSVRMGSLLPVYPMEALLRVGDSVEARPLALRFGCETKLRVDVPAPHVGVMRVGVEGCRFSDIFGFFSMRMRAREEMKTLTVLPRDFEVEPLRFLFADDGRALPNRQSEDLSSPEDTRAYRAGDALKRIHWKLSLRRRELLVRRFETPAPPDTLVLLDCTTPGDPADGPEDRAKLRDALCETALSVAAMQAAKDCPVRLPLYGERASEFTSDRSGTTGLLREMLAAQHFTGGEPFERVLMLELRRMRRTGSTVIITSHLNAQTVEGVSCIRRMGPASRVYLITKEPDAPRDRPFVSQLQQRMVEVCYVTPA